MVDIDMISVDSSDIVAVGYDTKLHILRVQFRRGTYDYFDVPEEIFEGLLTASSVGRYHREYVRGIYESSPL